MNLISFYKAVLDNDRAPIVLCDINHVIVYMNEAAIKRYGNKISIGNNLLTCHNAKSIELINKTLTWFNESVENNIIYESYNASENKDVYIVALRDDDKKLIGYYEKHEYRNSEKSKFYNFV